jgi:hypothetical protein
MTGSAAKEAPWACDLQRLGRVIGEICLVNIMSPRGMKLGSYRLPTFTASDVIWDPDTTSKLDVEWRQAMQKRCQEG